MSDVLEEFEDGGRLSNYNTDGVSIFNSNFQIRFFKLKMRFVFYWKALGQ